MTAQERSLALFFTEYGTKMSLVHLSLTAGAITGRASIDIAADHARIRMQGGDSIFFFIVNYFPSPNAFLISGRVFRIIFLEFINDA